jgi:hypothetical protein
MDDEDFSEYWGLEAGVCDLYEKCKEFDPERASAIYATVKNLYVVHDKEKYEIAYSRLCQLDGVYSRLNGAYVLSVNTKGGAPGGEICRRVYEARNWECVDENGELKLQFVVGITTKRAIDYINDRSSFYNTMMNNAGIRYTSRDFIYTPKEMSVLLGIPIENLKTVP